MDILETDGVSGNGLFSTINEPKGSKVGKKVRDFQGF
jgi:hypothetical protein